MDAIATARAALEARVDEIEAELRRLRRALEALASDDHRAPHRRAPRSRSQRTRKLAPRGERRRQLLAFLEANPNAKPAAIAAALDTSPANVHHVLRSARRDGVVRKVRGGGYRLSARKGGESSRP